jgi:hypothetical protein
LIFFIFFCDFLLNKALGERLGGPIFSFERGVPSPLDFDPVRPMV